MTRSHDTQRLPSDLAVVVPAYNPGERLRGVVDGLSAHVQKIIVVDDGCTDGSTEGLADEFALVRFDRNRGKGHALVAGYRRALEDPDIQCVAVLDADGQHDPEELPKLYEAFKRENADLVIGARDFGTGHVPWPSKFGNTLTVSVSALLLGRRIPDTQSGYRLSSRRFLEEILPSVRGGRYETEMELLGKAIRGGYAIESVPIRTIYEEGNRSSHFHKLRDSFLIYRKLLSLALSRR